ncbi:hypothetical protein EDD21DRAFT_380520 [Dissophora ornata]|nr:hypothetical protein EDD21DRAFT_380520 [Dissophora ornata]
MDTTEQTKVPISKSSIIPPPCIDPSDSAPRRSAPSNSTLFASVQPDSVFPALSCSAAPGSDSALPAPQSLNRPSDNKTIPARTTRAEKRQKKRAAKNLQTHNALQTPFPFPYKKVSQHPLPFRPSPPPIPAHSAVSTLPFPGQMVPPASPISEMGDGNPANPLAQRPMHLAPNGGPLIVDQANDSLANRPRVTSTQQTALKPVPSITKQLKVTMYKGFPIKTDCKISRKAAGECILRAVVHVLSREFNYITKDTFVQAYRALFGCPGMRTFQDAGILDSKVLSNIIETSIHKSTRFYRLNPAYFQRISSEQLGVHLPEKKMLFPKYAREAVPRIQQMPLRVIMQMTADVDVRLISIGENYGILCPTELNNNVPFHDLRRYLCLWHPASKWTPNHAAHIPDKDMWWSCDENIRIDQYAVWYTKALESGMEGKRARNAIERHANRILQPSEDERQKELARLLDGAPGRQKGKGRALPQSLGSDNGVIILDDEDSESWPVLRASNPASPATNNPAGPSISGPSMQTLSTPARSTPNEQRPQMEPEASTQPTDIAKGKNTHQSKPVPLPSSLPADVEPPTSVTSAPGVLESLSLRYQRDEINLQERDNRMDVVEETSTEGQDRALESGTAVPAKVSQANQMKTMLRQQRFKPYPGVSSVDTGSTLTKASYQKKALLGLSRTPGGGSGSGSTTQKKGSKPLGFIPPSGDGIFTLPRPILPPLGGQASPSSEMASATLNDQTGAMLGTEGSNLLMAGQFLGTTSRDQILKARREALEKIIEYTWKMPMRMDRAAWANGAASGSPSSSMAVSPTP